MNPSRAAPRGLLWVFGGLAVAALVAGVAYYLQTGREAAADDGFLRWGGDASGGAPYIIDRGPGQEPTGFEAEFARYLAQQLGKQPRFVQKQWDMLPQDLQRGDLDLVLNGYEWSAEREKTMTSSIPYFIYRLQLIVKKNGPIRGWDDLHGKSVGVLADSAAHRYVEKHFPDAKVVALSEEGVTGVLGKVVNGSLDATVQDLPAALHYVERGKDFPALRLLGEPVEPGYYVLFLRKADTELHNRLNEAIRAALADGTLRQIYDKYGLWNPEQERLLDAGRSWPPEVVASDESLGDYFPLLVRGACWTILLSVTAMPLAMLLGLLVAVGRLYGPGWLNLVFGGYVELLRGTPLLLQLSVIFYLLPNVGIKLDPFWAGMLGLAINYSAYEAENYRAGLLAIPKGQMEAALSLGMTTWTALTRVVIPQAVRIVIPPVTNDFIALFKDSSVCSVIAVAELTARYRGLMVNHPQYVVELGLLTAALYLAMSYPLSLVARRMEKRLAP